MENKSVFLTAEWRKLALAQYAVDAKILQKYCPPNTELDDWQGKYYVSLVGFMFKNVRLKGIAIPFHTNFEEVNLRFYVKYKENGIWKRGAVFISEIVPKPAITWVANTLYKEKYSTHRMRHSWEINNETIKVDYQWKNKKWHRFAVNASNQLTEMAVGSEEEFITEHYWGYTKIAENRTSEYGVEHPRWQVYPITNYQIEVDFGLNYGDEFAHLNQSKPDSVLLAEGSKIRVLGGRKF